MHQEEACHGAVILIKGVFVRIIFLKCVFVKIIFLKGVFVKTIKFINTYFY
jgi:hypothetical protein